MIFIFSWEEQNEDYQFFYYFFIADTILPTQDEIYKLMQNQFKLCGISAREAARNVNLLFGQNFVTEGKARILFRNFREERNKSNEDLLEKRFKDNPEVSAQELASGICSISTARRWLWKRAREETNILTNAQKTVNRLFLKIGRAHV